MLFLSEMHFLHPAKTFHLFCRTFRRQNLHQNCQRKPTRRLDAIVFRNFYCSHITIKRRRQLSNTAATTAVDDGTHEDPWVTILRDRPLMDSPHHEDDAQYWHVVTADEFDRKEYDPESTNPLRLAIVRFNSEMQPWGYGRFRPSYCSTAMKLGVCLNARPLLAFGRIYLYQSSPMWKTIGLHHMKIVSWSKAGSSGAEEDGSLVDSSGRRETDGNLGDLCRGITEQVEIFGDSRGLRQTR